MAKTHDMPGIGGYDFDRPVEPRVLVDYDLYGETNAPDMLYLDRVTEGIGSAALFPERVYVVHPGSAEYDAFTAPIDQSLDQPVTQREDQNA